METFTKFNKETPKDAPEELQGLSIAPIGFIFPLEYVSPYPLNKEFMQRSRNEISISKRKDIMVEIMENSEKLNVLVTPVQYRKEGWTLYVSYAFPKGNDSKIIDKYLKDSHDRPFKGIETLGIYSVQKPIVYNFDEDSYKDSV